MAELTSTALPDFVATLARAAAAVRAKKSDRPTAKEVVHALLQAEKTAKQQRLTYSQASLLGDWQLCFTAPRSAHFKSGTVQGKGFYLPQIAPAQISFSLPASTTSESTSQLEIGNQIQFGSLLFKLTGPAQYLGQKNLLAFDFTQMQLVFFGRTVYSGAFRGGKDAAKSFSTQSFAQLPFFAFFCVTEDFIAARGRGGGLALWVKQTKAN